MQFISDQHIDIIIKLSVATLLGVIIGFERFFVRKPAGMRTHSLVAMGSALFVIISEIIYQQYGIVGELNFDPLRMAAQIVIGVGFLGAGMIMLQNNKLVGLTTASGLWVSAGIGIACGFGMYGLAVIATVLVLIIFTLFYFLEEKIRAYEDGHLPHVEE